MAKEVPAFARAEIANNATDPTQEPQNRMLGRLAQMCLEFPEGQLNRVEVRGILRKIIPSPIDQNSCAHWRNPRDMMRQGRSTSLFQASQQWSTRSSYDLNIRFESQLSRMYCHTFSTGLSLGHLGGSVMMETLAGTTRRVDMCQPAWSTRRIAWTADSTAAAISARCRFIASVLQAGRIRAAPLPCFGQTAPKMYVEAVRWSRGALGRAPRFAQAASNFVLSGRCRPRRRTRFLLYRSRCPAAIVMRNSSNIHCARSISRQRTTPWTAGIEPLSTMRASARRWPSLSLDGCPGDLPSRRPSGPRALRRNTQSRMI